MNSYHQPCERLSSMESFALSAQHSGALNHHHTFAFNASVVDVLKEVRLTVTIVVAGVVAIAALRGLYKNSNGTA